MRLIDRLECDAVSQRDGHPDGPPCKRRVVVEQTRELNGSVWTTHFCARHRHHRPSGSVRIVDQREVPPTMATWTERKASPPKPRCVTCDSTHGTKDGFCQYCGGVVK